MAITSKPTGIHYAIVICLLTSIVCGLGWIQARRESDRSQEWNRHLTAEISQLQLDAAAAQKKAAECEAEKEKRIQEMNRRITSLIVIPHGPKHNIEDQAGRAAPGGAYVRWVDPIGKKVWISVGEDDGVDLRTAFDVHSKPQSRLDATKPGEVTAERTKGTIEITRVVEKKLSEARILKEDADDPIRKGDPIARVRSGVQ